MGNRYTTDMDFPAFPSRVASMLEAKGLSQAQAAAYSGLSKATMSRYISGKVKPELTIVVKLASYLGVTVDWLLGIDTASADPVPTDCLNLWNLYRRASGTDREQVRAILSRYASTDDGGV